MLSWGAMKAGWNEAKKLWAKCLPLVIPGSRSREFGGSTQNFGQSLVAQKSRERWSKRMILYPPSWLGCKPSFGGAHQKYWGFGFKRSIRNSYVGATINHPQTPSENTPNMASAANDSKLPSLSSPVPPWGNDSQRYRDGLPQLFYGQNRPVAAAATGKHRHDASTTRRAIT
jgi:hypothetical protein